MRAVAGLAVRARDVDRRDTPLRASRGTAAGRRCVRAWARRAVAARFAGVPTPASRLTCESSHAAGVTLGPSSRHGSRSSGCELDLHAASSGDRSRSRSRPRSCPRRARRRPPRRARRAVRRVSCTTTALHRRRQRHLLLRLLLAHRAEHLGRDRVHERIAVVAGVVGRSGHDARWIEPSCHHDHTSSVTNDEERREQSQQRRRARCAASPRAESRVGVAGVAVRRALHELDVVVAERPEEPLGAFEGAGVVERRRTRWSRPSTRSPSVREQRRGRAGAVTAPVLVGAAPATPSTNFDAFNILIASLRPIFI